MILPRSDKMATKGEASLRNQSGVALVIALIMIVVLTLIGLASTFTSDFEIKLSGNKRGSTDCFYTADSGVQGLQANIANFNFNSDTYATITDPTSLPQDFQNRSIDSKLKTPQLVLPAGPSFNKPPILTMYHTTLTGAPRGAHFSAAGNYQFAYFYIDSVGCDQLDVSPVTYNCEHEEEVFRLLPTSQGGI